MFPAVPRKVDTVLKRLSASLQRLPDRTRFVTAIVLYGAVASLVAVTFQVKINWIYRASFAYPSEVAPRMFPWMSLAIISGVSLFSGWLLTQFCPDGAGSGIPPSYGVPFQP